MAGGLANLPQRGGKFLSSPGPGATKRKKSQDTERGKELVAAGWQVCWLRGGNDAPDSFLDFIVIIIPQVQL